MNSTEGLRRISVVLRALGWITIAFASLPVIYAALTDSMSGLSDNVPLIFISGGLLLAGAYVVSGFGSGAQPPHQKNSPQSTPEPMHAAKPTRSTTLGRLSPGTTDYELMNYYGITRAGDQYAYGTYRFSELKKALAHARHLESLKLAHAPPFQPAATFGPITAPSPAVGAETNVAQVRPWVRYWARMFDIYLACIVAGLAIGILNPDALNEKGSDQLFAIVVIFAWVFVESIFLSTAGSTPGKWLLKTRLVPPSGTKPDYPTALSRSFKVWWRGLGIGFPVASLITLIVGHGNLKKNGVTSWDREDGFTVVHERIGPLRILVTIAFFVGFLLLVVVGNAASA